MRAEGIARMRAWALAAIVVVAPLAFDPLGFAPFGPVKWLLVSTLGFGVAVALAVDRRLLVPRGWGVGWVAFLAWGVVASIWAIDPLHTWVGTPDRRLGLVAWVVFAILFFGGARAAGRDAAIPLMKAAATALLGVGGYVLLELAGVPPVDLTATADRVGGPFGSAAYLAAACAVLLPVVVGAAIDGLGTTGWRRLAAAAAVLGGVAVLASQTRAAWLGIAAAVVVAGPALRRWLAAHRGAVAAASIGLVLVALVTPIADRLVSAVDFADGGARGRIDEWRVGGAVLAAHPVVGLGFEGYRIGFAEGVDAEYERRYGRVFTPDRAHSGILDVGVTAGVPAMAAYAAGAVALIATAMQAVRRREPWLVGIGAGVVAYVVQQQFLFPVAEVDPVFWVFAGVLVASTRPTTLRRIGIPAGMWLVPTALAVAALVAGGLDVRADHITQRALDMERRGDAAAAVAEIDGAVAARPDSIRYAYVAASMAGRSGSIAGLRLALGRIGGALDVSPRDPILLAAGAGYRLDLAVAERSSEQLRRATDEWEALVAHDPHHAQYRLELGIAYAVGGRHADAEQEWVAAADLAPRSTAPLTNLATLYLDGGRLDDARAAIEGVAAIDAGAPVLDELRRRLADLDENG